MTKKLTKEQLSTNIEAICLEKWQRIVGELKDPVDIEEVKQVSAQIAKWMITGKKEVLESWELTGELLACRLARKKSKLLWLEFKDAVFKAMPQIIGYVWICLGGV